MLFSCFHGAVTNTSNLLVAHRDWSRSKHWNGLSGGWWSPHPWRYLRCLDVALRDMVQGWDWVGQVDDST